MLKVTKKVSAKMMQGCGKQSDYSCGRNARMG